MNIIQKKKKIIQNFQTLGEDIQTKLEYLIEIGEKLPPFPKKERIEDNKIAGCMSQVWLIHQYKNNLLTFMGDSNTVITKGLISILINFYMHETPQIILNHNLTWLQEIGLYHMIGPQRANGLAYMVNKFKIIALQYLKKND